MWQKVGWGNDLEDKEENILKGILLEIVSFVTLQGELKKADTVM